MLIRVVSINNRRLDDPCIRTFKSVSFFAVFFLYFSFDGFFVRSLEFFSVLDLLVGIETKWMCMWIYICVCVLCACWTVWSLAIIYIFFLFMRFAKWDWILKTSQYVSNIYRHMNSRPLEQKCRFIRVFRRPHTKKCWNDLCLSFVWIILLSYNPTENRFSTPLSSSRLFHRYLT